MRFCAQTLRRGTIAPHITRPGGGDRRDRRRDQRMEDDPSAFSPTECLDPLNGRLPAPADLLRYRGATDLRHARTCLGVEDGALLVQVRTVARRLIDDDWASVVRITEALQRHGRLTGEQVVSIWRGLRSAA